MDEIASGAIDENEQERNIIYNSTFIRRQSGLNNNQSSGRSFIREEQKAFMRAWTLSGIKARALFFWIIS